MICPYLSGIDLEGRLVKVECLKHECIKYTQMLGLHPQTGQEISEWNCSDAWLPMLLIENSQQTRQAGAAVESFRNEVVNVGKQLADGVKSIPRGDRWLESK